MSCPRLPYNELGTTYTVLAYPDDVHASVATMPTTLRFMARDCDPATGVPDADQGYNDEYMVHIFLMFSQFYALIVTIDISKRRRKKLGELKEKYV